MNKHKCNECSKIFTRKYRRDRNPKKRFCSLDCRYKNIKKDHPSKGEVFYKFCDICNTKVSMGKFNFNRERVSGFSCSLKCKHEIKRRMIGEKNKLYKNGLSIGNGYLVRTSSNGLKKQKILARCLVEEHIGRELEKDEAIFYVNKDKTIMDIEKLIPMTRSHHRRANALAHALEVENKDKNARETVAKIYKAGQLDIIMDARKERLKKEARKRRKMSRMGVATLS